MSRHDHEEVVGHLDRRILAGLGFDALLRIATKFFPPRCECERFGRLFVREVVEVRAWVFDPWARLDREEDI